MPHMRLYTNCLRNFLLLATALCVCGTVLAQTPGPAYKVGRPPTAEELRTWDVMGPDGKGLPAGKGTAKEGAVLFAAKCAPCHGQEGEGVGSNPRLVEGAGAPDATPPNACRVDHFQFAPTLWDYINRSMPLWPMQKDLTPDNVYALTAFLLFKNGIIKETDVMDKDSLVKVRMSSGH